MNKISNQISEYWIKQLKASGYKLTRPRYFVVDILTNTDKALTAHDIFKLAQAHYPSLGLVSVYRTLDKLESLGLIQRVHREDKCQAYITAPNGHEHLLVCRFCGRVSFFKGDDLDPLVRKVEKQSGFQVQKHWLQLIGVCETCKKEHLDEVLSE